MKICHHLWGTSQLFPLHEEPAAESRHLLFRSMKCPWLLSQLCFKVCRSSLLSPWEQRRRSWTSSDKPSRAALSQGPDTWQPVGEIQRIYFILSVFCTKTDLETKSSRSLFWLTLWISLFKRHPLEILTTCDAVEPCLYEPSSNYSDILTNNKPNMLMSD